MRYASCCGVAAFAFLSILSGSALAQERSPVELYDERCAACHTVGGGESGGPDFLPSTSWPRDELRTAVERMQENTGPMTPEQVDAIADLLADPDVKSLPPLQREQAEGAGTAETRKRTGGFGRIDPARGE